MANERLAMSNWKKGTVSLFQAFGIRSSNIHYPPLDTQLDKDVTSAQQQAQTKSPQPGATGGNLGNPQGGTQQQNQVLGQQMAAAQPYNWTAQNGEWQALNNIVMAESGWSTTAENPSGAYGIPQSLPASKMASAGADWQTNPRTQIAWMLGYIRSTYGDPIRAWQWHLAHNWY
jgi:hypothetical protein